jgi:alanine racemase
MTHASVLEIHLEALQHNFNFFKRRLTKSTKILGVVKAFAYGSDAILIAKYLEEIGAHYLAVAYTKEGIVLRKTGIKLPILVLHPQEKSLNQLVENNLEPNIYNLDILKTFIAVAKAYNKKGYPIHLKFNTGLNRLGFSVKEIDTVFNLINKTPSVKVTSVLSHLAASEDLNEKDFTNNQISLFKDIITATEKALDYTPLFHLLNTSGVVNYPEAQFDMVRIGIGLYGFGNDDAITKQLKSVGILKSCISQINFLKKGDSIGYNRAHFAKNAMRIATIPIGHADGISRQLGNGKGYVYINNQKAFIVGNVCMDMLMVDVSNINCKEGDEVVVYKDQQHVEDLAKLQNTIPYELLTAISQRIVRKII